MKLNLSNRGFQWALALLFGLMITVSAHSFFNQEAVSTQSPPLHETVAGAEESPPLEIPRPVEDPAAPVFSKRLVEYHIAVSLKPDDKTLQGVQSVAWINSGSKPVTELYFHLYPNAFASDKTTFMQESGGRLRNDTQSKNSYGYMEIHSILTEEGTDILPRLSFVQPDDGNKHDHTLAKLELLEPVQPGGKITLKMDYEVKLPQVFARMGYAGNFVMAGQWFPKLAKYETAGTRGRTEDGWNLHQYHGNSEFYADFGIYSVKIEVPANYTVAATGFPVKQAAVTQDSKTYHFYADDVHDFAWAASPDFIYVEEPFSAAGVPGVKIKLYLDPAHEHLKSRYFSAARKALSRYSQWYGDYPYSTLSIVVPPAEGNGAGGMEYPTLITAWGASEPSPGLDLERVIIHEIGHQYWYGMVASNEFEEAWLDEAFTSYAEDKVMEKEYGISSNLAVESSYMTSPASLHLHSWEYGSHEQYAENVYMRGKLVLYAIEQEIGTDSMSKVMRSYFQRWKFGHPSTSDFQAILEQTTKKDWQPFFDHFVYGGEMIDYEVAAIEVNRTYKEASVIYENQVLVRKNGVATASVPIRFSFKDGTIIDKNWDGEGSEIMFTLAYSHPIDWVLIDPEYTLILENKHINNFMKNEIDKQSSIRWNIGITSLLELLFHALAW